jgi:hypothetical protein
MCIGLLLVNVLPLRLLLLLQLLRLLLQQQQ